MVELIGALLFIGGVLYMAGAAIWRGRLSKPTATVAAPGSVTLEPPVRGLRFLGMKANWPGFLMVAVGAALLLSAALA